MDKVEMVVTKHIGKKFIKINGEYYASSKNRETKKKDVLMFEKVDPIKYEKSIDIIAGKISEKTNVKDIIKQALYEMNVSQIAEIANELDKPKPKIKQGDGCVFVKVGKQVIMLRE